MERNRVAKRRGRADRVDPCWRGEIDRVDCRVRAGSRLGVALRLTDGAVHFPGQECDNGQQHEREENTGCHDCAATGRASVDSTGKSVGHGMSPIVAAPSHRPLDAVPHNFPDDLDFVWRE